MLPVSLNFINGDPLFDRSKLKVQTAGRQEPRPCLQILFAKINYFPKNERTNGRTDERTDISFSSLPDGKSASRKNLSLRRHDSFGGWGRNFGTTNCSITLCSRHKPVRGRRDRRRGIDSMGAGVLWKTRPRPASPRGLI